MDLIFDKHSIEYSWQAYYMLNSFRYLYKDDDDMFV